jgi:thiol peroxidase
MATIAFKGGQVKTAGDLPKVGQKAPDFELVRQDLSTARLSDYRGKKKVLNVFPSIDTPVCQMSVRAFNQKAGARGDTVVLNVSADLPFASKRFCAAEGLQGVQTLSTFRSDFGKDYGVAMTDGPLQGLLSRAVVVLDENDKVLHAQQVPDIGKEPDYDKALAALGQ